MKLVAISDTHGYHHKVNLPPADVFIYAGDFSNQGTIQEFGNFCGWLESLPHTHKLVVPGNHDRFCHRAHSLARAMINEVGAEFLVDSSIVINDVWFYGSPWTPQFGNWAFMKDRAAMRYVWEKVPLETDVLITHGPPRGIMDKSEYDGDLIGCPFLLGKILQVKPKHHIFGHCHNKGGAHYKFEDTEFHNVAYGPEDTEAQVIEID